MSEVKVDRESLGNIGDAKREKERLLSAEPKIRGGIVNKLWMDIWEIPDNEYSLVYEKLLFIAENSSKEVSGDGGYDYGITRGITGRNDDLTWEDDDNPYDDEEHGFDQDLFDQDDFEENEVSYVEEIEKLYMYKVISSKTKSVMNTFHSIYVYDNTESSIRIATETLNSIRRASSPGRFSDLLGVISNYHSRDVDQSQYAEWINSLKIVSSRISQLEAADRHGYTGVEPRPQSDPQTEPQQEAAEESLQVGPQSTEPQPEPQQEAGALTEEGYGSDILNEEQIGILLSLFEKIDRRGLSVIQSATSELHMQLRSVVENNENSSEEILDYYNKIFILFVDNYQFQDDDSAFDFYRFISSMGIVNFLKTNIDNLNDDIESIYNKISVHSEREPGEDERPELIGVGDEGDEPVEHEEGGAGLEVENISDELTRINGLRQSVGFTVEKTDLMINLLSEIDGQEFISIKKLMSRLFNDLRDVNKNMWFFNGWKIVGSESYSDFNQNIIDVSKEILWEIVGFDYIFEKGTQSFISELESIFSFIIETPEELIGEGAEAISLIDEDSSGNESGDEVGGYVVKKITKDDLDKVRGASTSSIVSNSNSGYTSFKLLVSENPASNSLFLSDDVRSLISNGDISDKDTVGNIYNRFKSVRPDVSIRDIYFNKAFSSFAVEGVSLDFDRVSINDLSERRMFSLNYLYIKDDNLYIDKERFSDFIESCNNVLEHIISKYTSEREFGKDDLIREANSLIASMKILEEENILFVENNLEGYSRESAIRWLIDNEVSIASDITSGSISRRGDVLGIIENKSQFFKNIFFLIQTIEDKADFYSLRTRGDERGMGLSQWRRMYLPQVPDYIERQGVSIDVAAKYINQVARAQFSKIDQMFDIGGSLWRRDGSFSENDILNSLISIETLRGNFYSYMKEASAAYERVKCPVCRKDGGVRFSLRNVPRNMRMFYEDNFAIDLYSPYLTDDDGNITGIITNDMLSSGNMNDGMWTPPSNLRSPEAIFYDTKDKKNWRTRADVERMAKSDVSSISDEGSERLSYIKFLIQNEDAKDSPEKIWPPPPHFKNKVFRNIEFDSEDPANWMSWEQINALISEGKDRASVREGLMRRAEVYRLLGARRVSKEDKPQRIRDIMFECPFKEDSDSCGISFLSSQNVDVSNSSTLINLQPSGSTDVSEFLNLNIDVKRKKYYGLFQSLDDFVSEFAISIERPKEEAREILEEMNKDVDFSSAVIVEADFVVWHESLESIAISSYNDLLQKEKPYKDVSSPRDILKRIKDNNAALKSIDDDIFYDSISKDNYSPIVIEISSLGASTVDAGLVSYNENNLYSDAFWEGKDRSKFDNMVKRKGAGGYKFSREMFPCPCVIEEPDPSMSGVYSTMAIPHSGPVGFNKDYVYSPPTNPDGTDYSPEIGTMGYLICGAPTSLSSFSRSPDLNNENTIRAIIKKYRVAAVDALISYGVDIHDLKPFVDEIEKGFSNGNLDMSKISSKDYRMKKFSKLFSEAMATSIRGGENNTASFKDIISDLELVCPNGHSFTVRQSWDFGKSHMSLHLHTRNESLGVDRKTRLMRKNMIDKLMPILESKGVFNLANMLNERTKSSYLKSGLFKKVPESEVYSLSEGTKTPRGRHRAFLNYLETGNVGQPEFVSNGGISGREFKGGYFLTIPEMSSEDLKEIFGDDVPDGCEALIRSISGTYVLNKSKTKGMGYQNNPRTIISHNIVDDGFTYETNKARTSREFIEDIRTAYYESSTATQTSEGIVHAEDNASESVLNSYAGTEKDARDFAIDSEIMIGSESAQRNFLRAIRSNASIVLFMGRPDGEIQPSPEFVDIANKYIIQNEYDNFMYSLELLVRIIKSNYSQALLDGVYHAQLEEIPRKQAPELSVITKLVYKMIDNLSSGSSPILLRPDNASIDPLSNMVSQYLYRSISNIDFNQAFYKVESDDASRLVTSNLDFICMSLTKGIVDSVYSLNSEIELSHKTVESGFTDDFYRAIDSVIGSKEITDNNVMAVNILNEIENFYQGDFEDDDDETVYHRIVDILNSNNKEEYDGHRLIQLIGTLPNKMIEVELSYSDIEKAVRRYINNSFDPWITKRVNTEGKSKIKQGVFSPNSKDVKKKAYVDSDSHDIRRIYGATVILAHTLYLCDSLRTISSIYLDKYSDRYIGIDTGIFNGLRSADDVLQISESELENLPSKYDDLRPHDIRNISKSLASYIKDKGSGILSSSNPPIISPMSECYSVLNNLIKNNKTVFSNYYMDKAKEILKDHMINNTGILDSGGLVSHTFDFVAPFRTLPLSGDAVVELRPPPVIGTESKGSGKSKGYKTILSRAERLIEDGSPYFIDNRTGYDSRKVQIGKIAPTRSWARYFAFDEDGTKREIDREEYSNTRPGVRTQESGYLHSYPPNLDMDYSTSVGYVLPIVRDTSTAKYKSRMGNFIVPKFKLYISINDKPYDVSFLLKRRNDMSDNRNKIDILSRTNLDIERSIRSDSKKVEKINRKIVEVTSIIESGEESAGTIRRARREVEDLSNELGILDARILESRARVLKNNESMSGIQNIISNEFISVSTSTQNLAYDQGSENVDYVSVGVTTKTLPAVYFVDPYSAYQLITNPDSAPHPYTSIEEQDDLLVFIFEAFNFGPILDALTSDNKIRSSRLYSLERNYMYDIGVLPKRRYSRIARHYPNAKYFVLKNVNSDKKNIDLYEEGEVGEFNPQHRPVATISIPSNVPIESGRLDYIRKIRKIFDPGFIQDLQDEGWSLSKSYESLASYRGDVTENDIPGKYFDVIHTDDSGNSITNITYSLNTITKDIVQDSINMYNDTRTGPGSGSGGFNIKNAIAVQRILWSLKDFLIDGAIDRIKDAYLSKKEELFLVRSNYVQVTERMKAMSESGVSNRDPAYKALNAKRSGLRKNISGIERAMSQHLKAAKDLGFQSVSSSGEMTDIVTSDKNFNFENLAVSSSRTPYLRFGIWDRDSKALYIEAVSQIRKVGDSGSIQGSYFKNNNVSRSTVSDLDYIKMFKILAEANNISIDNPIDLSIPNRMSDITQSVQDANISFDLVNRMSERISSFWNSSTRRRKANELSLSSITSPGSSSAGMSIDMAYNILGVNKGDSIDDIKIVRNNMLMDLRSGGRDDGEQDVKRISQIQEAYKTILSDRKGGVYVESSGDDNGGKIIKRSHRLDAISGIINDVSRWR